VTISTSNKRPLWTLGIGAAAALAAGVGWPLLQSARPKETVVPHQDTPPPARVRAEGRLVPRPGARVALGTELAGRLVFLAEERAQVRSGQVVAEIDASELRPALVQARARMAEADAQVRFLGEELARTRQLAQQDAIAPAALHRAQYDHDTAVARRDAARAEAERLAAIVAKTRIAAPIAGVVIAHAVERGETVPAGARLLTLADPVRTCIEAEVDEFDAAGVSVGNEAIVSVEGYPGERWRGQVEEIPPDVVPSRLRPQDPSRPSDTNVLVVRIQLERTSPLKLGQRVQVEITRAAAVTIDRRQARQ
jgi:RND family efflux transporter MFP subunit